MSKEPATIGGDKAITDATTVQFKREQKVVATVQKVSEEHGLFVTLDETDQVALVPLEEVVLNMAKFDLKEFAEGEKIFAYIQKVEEDGRIKASLRPVGKLGKEAVMHEIVKKMEASPDGKIPIGSKSSVEEISAVFPGMSKGYFKQAIGALFKTSRVEMNLIQTETQLIRKKKKLDRKKGKMIALNMTAQRSMIGNEVYGDLHKENSENKVKGVDKDNNTREVNEERSESRYEERYEERSESRYENILSALREGEGRSTHTIADYGEESNNNNDNNNEDDDDDDDEEHEYKIIGAEIDDTLSEVDKKDDFNMKTNEHFVDINKKVKLQEASNISEHDYIQINPTRRADAEFDSLSALQDNVMKLFNDKKIVDNESDDEDFWKNIFELRSEVIEKLERNAHLQNEKAMKGLQIYNLYKKYKREVRKDEWNKSRKSGSRSRVEKSKQRLGKRERMTG